MGYEKYLQDELFQIGADVKVKPKEDNTYMLINSTSNKDVNTIADRLKTHDKVNVLKVNDNRSSILVSVEED